MKVLFVIQPHQAEFKEGVEFQIASKTGNIGKDSYKVTQVLPVDLDRWPHIPKDAVMFEATLSGQLSKPGTERDYSEQPLWFFGPMKSEKIGMCLSAVLLEGEIKFPKGSSAEGAPLSQ